MLVVTTRKPKTKTMIAAKNGNNGLFSLRHSFLLQLTASIAMLLLAGLTSASTPYQQDSGSNGIVSIEVEAFSGNTPQGGHTWELSYPSGHSGTGALEALPNSGINNNADFVNASPRLDYPIQFNRGGIHYVWVRALGVSGTDDSLHVGLDGAGIASASRVGNLPRQLGWHNTLMGGSVALIDVPAAGEHTLNLWMREDGAVIDKVVLTSSISYVPSGSGPSTSVLHEPEVVGSAFPLEFSGAAPEQAVIDHHITKPSGSQLATVILSSFDADFVDEGELVINGNPPVALFGDKASSSNDDQTVFVEFTTPAEYWRDGSNSVVFRHIRTAGFGINSMNVSFSGSAVDDTEEASDDGAVLIDLTAAAPEETSLSLDVVKPAAAANAVISLAVFDADVSDEGELLINGNAPLPLFGSAASSANDGNAAKIDINTPASYWRNGSNSLLFRHTRTGGFIIDNVVVTFDGEDAGAPSNLPPTLSGTPSSTAVVGHAYSFQPNAADTDGGTLTFSISNRPSWAGFDVSTGLLSGTPGQGDAGTYSNIRISVSDGSSSVPLPAFTITVAGGDAVETGSITLRWTTPSTREDGSHLALDEIVGYTISYGPSPGLYTQSLFVPGGDKSSATLSNLPVGETLYIALTTSDASGLKSSYSNVAQVRVQ